MSLGIYLREFEDGISIDHLDGESFPSDQFLLELQKIIGFKVLSKENIHSSVGPLGYIDKYSTTWGDLYLEVQIEEVQYNVQLNSKSQKLVKAIRQVLEKSNLFVIYKSYEELRNNYT